jgi:hypothetical protein
VKPRHLLPAIFLLLLLAYPLSVGPLVLWEARSYHDAPPPPPPPKWLEDIYAPLAALYHSSPPVHQVLDWYIGLWLKNL